MDVWKVGETGGSIERTSASDGTLRRTVSEAVDEPALPLASSARATNAIAVPSGASGTVNEVWRVNGACVVSPSDVETEPWTSPSVSRASASASLALARTGTTAPGAATAVTSTIATGSVESGAIARTATNIRSGARTPVAGMVHALTLLAILLVCLWLHVGWRGRPPRVFTILRLPDVSRRLLLAMTALVLAAAVPDVALTGLWSEYLARMRNLVDTREGIIRAADLPLLDWPDKLFAQDWTLPAMSALVSRTPGRAYVLLDKDYLSNPPFDPACGTLPSG